jgi:hypothetical protein
MEKKPAASATRLQRCLGSDRVPVIFDLFADRVYSRGTT